MGVIELRGAQWGAFFLLAKVSRNWAHRWWEEGERQGEGGKGEEVEEKDFFRRRISRNQEIRFTADRVFVGKGGITRRVN